MPKPKPQPKPQPEIDLNRALTLQQFCYLENISIYTYQKLRKDGWGPREQRVPGTDIIRITPEARAEWKERLQGKEAQDQLKRERERRAVFAKAQGKEAAKSSKHISNVRRAKSARAGRPPSIYSNTTIPRSNKSPIAG